MFQRFVDPKVVVSLACLADVFGILNSFSIPPRAAEATLSEAKGKVQSFKEKLGPWSLVPEEDGGNPKTMQIFLSFRFSTSRGTESLRERYYVPRNSESHHGGNYAEFG